MSVNLMQAEELQTVNQIPERFEVTNLQSANWVLRKLQALAAKENEINQLADAEIKRHEAWREEQLKGIRSHREHLESYLIDWHKQLLDEDPKHNKSVKLPYGTLKSVTRKPIPKMADEEKVLAHLKANGDSQYIKTKEIVKWNELKKKLKNGIAPTGNPLNPYHVVDWNGEEIPGVEVDLGGTTFEVEVNE